MKARLVGAAILAAGAVASALLVAVILPLVLALAVYAGDSHQVWAALFMSFIALITALGLAVVSVRLATIVSVKIGGRAHPSEPLVGLLMVSLASVALLVAYLFVVLAVR
jgi:hypothetical protein